jgi:hypothetical protein
MFAYNFVESLEKQLNDVVIPNNHIFTECKTCSHLKAVLKGKPEYFGSDMFGEHKVNANREIGSRS